MKAKPGVTIAREIGDLDIGDVFDTKDVLAWVAKYYYPDQVFPETELTDWAESKGFVKEEEG